MYRGIAAPKDGDGSTFLLWNDVWNDSFLKHEFPRLFSYAKKHNQSLFQYLQNQDMAENFHMPISVAAMEEYGPFRALNISQEMQGKN